MPKFGALDAKSNFDQLLDLVEQGEDVTIIRDGEEIARLIPVPLRADRDNAHAALARIRHRAERAKLGSFDWSEWKAYRDEGRP